MVLAICHTWHLRFRSLISSLEIVSKLGCDLGVTRLDE